MIKHKTDQIQNKYSNFRRNKGHSILYPSKFVNRVAPVGEVTIESRSNFKGSFGPIKYIGMSKLSQFSEENFKFFINRKSSFVALLMDQVIPPNPMFCF